MKNNETLHTLLNRRSIRSFDSRPIEEEDLESILQAGLFAPSGMNQQSTKLIAVLNRDIRDRLSQENAAVMKSHSDPFYGAPVLIMVLANKNIPTYLEDGSAVMSNLLHAAASLGIGSCWIHRCKEVIASEYGQELLKKLNISSDYVGVANCILGYPADSTMPIASPRKDNRIIKIK